MAMVGGRDWAASQVNLAVGVEGGGSGRQAGSTFKPIVLAEAMTRRATASRRRTTAPAKIVLPKADNGADWEVNNYESANFGRINLLDATANSVNTVYAQLVVQVGADKVVDMAKRLGVKSDLQPHSSIALGTAERVGPRHGQRLPHLPGQGHAGRAPGDPQAHPGRLRAHRRPAEVATRVLDRAVADKVDFALQQVVMEGSGTAAALPAGPGLGQDRHHREVRRRLVRRLHPPAHHRGVDGLSRGPVHTAVRHPRREEGQRRVAAGADLQAVHDQGQPARPHAAQTRSPDLSGKSPAPVSSVATSGSGTSSGSSGSSSATTTTGPGRRRRPATTVKPSTATTVAEPVTVPTTQPAFTPPDGARHHGRAPAPTLRSPSPTIPRP